MYIGPWQEYNLSKARTGAEVGNKVNESLRPGIEQALLQSLDPEVAKKAMEAMMPYFGKPTAPPQPRQQNHHHRNIGRKRAIRNLPALHSSINSPLAVTARERSLHSSSPMSVRSTQSEPIRYTNTFNRAVEPPTPKISTPRRSVPSASQPGTSKDYVSIEESPPRHAQPAYDASAAVNILRLERNTKARSEIAKLTGWKIDPSLGIGIGMSDNIKAQNQNTSMHQRVVKDSMESRLVQVNTMKQLYLAGKEQNKSDQSSDGLRLPPLYKNTHETHTLTLSNLAKHNDRHGTETDLRLPPVDTAVPFTPYSVDTPLRTPRIGDIDLNDEAFGLVSKYFQVSSFSDKESEEPSVHINRYSSTQDDTECQYSNLDNGNSEKQLGEISKEVSNSHGNLSRMDHSQGMCPSKSALALMRVNGIQTPINDELESETTSMYGAASPNAYYELQQQQPDKQSYGHNDKRNDENINNNNNFMNSNNKDSSGTVESSEYDGIGEDGEDIHSNMDELYVGGLDGLLKWSSQLELDLN